MKFDRAGALAFLEPIWKLKDRLSWHVDLTLGSANTPSTWYLADYPDSSDGARYAGRTAHGTSGAAELVRQWATVAHHFDGHEGRLVAYDGDELVGGKVRSSWCFFDHRPERLIVEAKIPGLVLPTLTNKREHWGAALRRSQAHRGQVKMMANLALAKTKGSRTAIAEAMAGAGEIGSNRYGGLLVKITRLADKMCDHDDGVNTSCKHVRDGVADAIGYDDGDLGISWHYDQRRPGTGEVPGAIVRVYERDGCPTCLQYVARKIS